MSITLLSRIIVSLRLSPFSGERDLLWYVDDGEYRYTHIVQIGLVSSKDGARGFQIVIGPLLFTIATRKGLWGQR